MTSQFQSKRLLSQQLETKYCRWNCDWASPVVCRQNRDRAW